MSNTTYRAFAEKLGASNSEEFVGDKGELFWDPDTLELSGSDGQTPGGVGIKVKSLDITSRYVDQFQWMSTFADDNLVNNESQLTYGQGVAVGSNGYGYVIGGDNDNGYTSIIKFYPEPDAYDIYDSAVYLDNLYWQSAGQAISVHKDAENGDTIYVLTLTSNQTIILVQLDQYLNVNWSTEISGSNINGCDLVTDSSNNVYVVGWSQSDGYGNNIYVIKFGSDGAIFWDGSARAIGQYGGGRAWGVDCDGSDLYVIGRTTQSGQGGADILVFKLSTIDGSTIWQKTLGIPDSYTWEYGYGIKAGKSGIFITADARDPINNTHSIFTAKLTKSGELLWQKFANSIYNDGRGDCVAVDEKDNVYLSGWVDYPFIDAETNLNSRADLVLLKYDTNGNLLYKRAIGQRGDDYSNQEGCHHNMAIDGDFLWITGSSNFRFYDDGYTFTGFVIRLTADGDNEGVYGEYLVQDVEFITGEANLVLADSNLNNHTSSVSFNGGSVTTSGLNYRFTLKFRAPFELNLPKGTVTAGVVRAKEIRLGDIPIKSFRDSWPYNWAGHNLYVGEGAGFNAQEGSYHNIVIGKYSGVHNTYGSNNIFLGKDSGHYNTTGYRNVFIGHGAGYGNLSGSYNVIIGDVDLGDTDYSLAIGSAGNSWITGDNFRNVSVSTPGAALKLTSPNGTPYALTVDDSGNLKVGTNTVQYI